MDELAGPTVRCTSPLYPQSLKLYGFFPRLESTLPTPVKVENEGENEGEKEGEKEVERGKKEGEKY